MKSVSMKQRLAGKKSLKKQWMQKESVSKQGRKPAKAEPTVHKDPAFDELDDDTIDYIETEDAQDMGRTSYVVHEEKESAEKGVSTEDPLSTAQPKVSTDKPEDSTDKPDEGTNKPKVSTNKEEVSTNRPDEGTVDQNEGRSATQTAPITTTLTIFGNDETIAQVLIIMSQNKEKLKEKEKGVELKDVEETKRPRPTSTRSLLTLKPLPKIDPKDKGKKMIEEEDDSDTDSEYIIEAEKKFKQLARDEEVAIMVQEDWEAEEEVKKLAEEEATKAAFSNEYDFFQARHNAIKYLLKKLKEEGSEILYDEIKRSDNSFIAIGSAKNEKVIKEMNEQVIDASKKRVKKDDSIKGEIKEEEGTRKKEKLVSVEDNGKWIRRYIDKKYPIIRMEIWCGCIVSWKLHSSSGIHTIMTDEGIVIHMLVENKYPLKKEVLSQLLKLKLETKEDSTMALELIRFVKKQIAELEPRDSERDEKDL
ncbi:hypothetical protein Tco_0236936 [Tanacetum coccineum]